MSVTSKVTLLAASGSGGSASWYAKLSTPASMVMEASGFLATTGNDDIHISVLDYNSSDYRSYLAELDSAGGVVKSALVDSTTQADYGIYSLSFDGTYLVAFNQGDRSSNSAPSVALLSPSSYSVNLSKYVQNGSVAEVLGSFYSGGLRYHIERGDTASIYAQVTNSGISTTYSSKYQSVGNVTNAASGSTQAKLKGSNVWFGGINTNASNVFGGRPMAWVTYVSGTSLSTPNKGIYVGSYPDRTTFDALEIDGSGNTYHAGRRYDGPFARGLSLVKGNGNFTSPSMAWKTDVAPFSGAFSRYYAVNTLKLYLTASGKMYVIGEILAYPNASSFVAEVNMTSGALINLKLFECVSNWDYLYFRDLVELTDGSIVIGGTFDDYSASYRTAFAIKIESLDSLVDGNYGDFYITSETPSQSTSTDIYYDDATLTQGSPPNVINATDTLTVSSSTISTAVTPI